MRITPSTTLNSTWLPNTGYMFFNLVAATSGTNLYIAMKKPTEMMMLSAMAHPLISSFFCPCSSAGRNASMATSAE